MKNKILIIMAVLLLILIGCGKKKVETGPATIEKLTDTVYRIIGKTTDGEDAIESLKYDDNVVSVVAKRAGAKKENLLYNSSRLIESIYKYDGVDNITISWKTSFSDSFGNVVYKPILKMTISKETADKIQWDTFDVNKLEVVADEYEASKSLDTK